MQQFEYHQNNINKETIFVYIIPNVNSLLFFSRTQGKTYS